MGLVFYLLMLLLILKDELTRYLIPSLISGKIKCIIHAFMPFMLQLVIGYITIVKYPSYKQSDSGIIIFCFTIMFQILLNRIDEK